MVAAGLDDATIGRIRRDAESKKSGSGWTVVAQATAERVQRKSELEAAARRVLVDVDAVHKDAGARNENELDALEQAVAEAEPVVAAARAAGLDEATIGRIRRDAESKKPGSGWTAVAQATAERVQRRSELEAAARRVLVDIDAVYKDARVHNADELDALEQAVAEAEPVVAAARAAGLDEATIGRIRRDAESKKSGSGWTAVAQGTAERVQRKSELEAGGGGGTGGGARRSDDRAHPPRCRIEEVRLGLDGGRAGNRGTGAAEVGVGSCGPTRPRRHRCCVQGRRGTQRGRARRP